MKTYRFQAAVSACLLLSGLACVSGATGGYEAPRMPDGAPDLRGIWEVAGTVNRNLEGYPAKGDVPAAKSVIIDPKSGKIPYRPEAEAKRNELANASPTADPQAKCDMAGVPRVTYIPSPFQIFQSANTVAIVYQDVHAFRWIPTGGRPHLDGADFWMGDSRGHWDGNTLVVDVTDLNDQTWLDETGTFHTDNLHVIERYTRTGPDTIKYQATLEDATVFTKPWTIQVMLHRETKPGARIVEDECYEDEQGVWHHTATSGQGN